MITLTHDKIINEIPYAVICEAHEGSRWRTGRRRRLYDELFTKFEQAACVRLFSKAADWTLVTGAPDSIRMNKDTYALWQKLGSFCASL